MRAPLPACAVLLLLLLPGAARAGEALAGSLRVLADVPAGALAGAAVADCEGGAWMLRRNASKALALASTTKLLTSAAALAVLGPQYRFRTRVVGLGAPEDGVLPGLGVIGGGSPCLDEHFSDKQPDRIFAAWAETLKRRGITRIAGGITVDARMFSGPIRPATYPQDAGNRIRWYSAPASAFAFNDNCIEVRAVPTRLGQPCRVELRPDSPRIAVRNLTRTATKGDAVFAVNRDGDSNAITVSGSYSAATAWFPVAIHEDPDLLAADHLRRALTTAGIRVDGEVRLGAIDPDSALPLIDVKHELWPALTLMNQHSQNFYAEQLLRLVGVHRRGEGSIAAGRAAVAEAVAPLLGDEAERFEILDGSGLSYGNTGTAAGLVRLLVAQAAGADGATFVSTLKDKLAGRIQGHVKTGTLAIACNLAGYLDLPGGRRVAFAILLNQGEAKAVGWAPKIRDRFFAALADDLTR